MKKLFLIPAALVLALGARAQEVSSLDKDITEKDVPKAVVAAFNKANPGQKIDRWEMKGKNFEADYTKDGAMCEMQMTKDGKLVENEMAINVKDVPKAVLDAVATNKEAKGWTIDHAEQVSTPKHKMLYEVTVKKDNAMMGLYYTPDGKTLVRTEKE